MIYRISWSPDAFRMLERIWDEQDDLTIVVNAVDEIHDTLTEDAEIKGESRERGRRILIVSPLGVVFQAQPRLGEVLIVRVWFMRSRGSAF